jgi:hypothetical protein
MIRQASARLPGDQQVEVAAFIGFTAGHGTPPRTADVTAQSRGEEARARPPASVITGSKLRGCPWQGAVAESTLATNTLRNHATITSHFADLVFHLLQFFAARKDL